MSDPEDEMDDAIDAWLADPGSQSLHEYLGLTWNEYAAWVEGRAPDTRPSRSPSRTERETG